MPGGARASCIADFAVSWHSTAARQAVLYSRRATSPGSVRMRFQANFLALTDSEHSGVHHGGSEGRVLSCFAGINCFMPRLMCAVMLEHATSTVPENIECQSVEPKSCFSRGQSARLYHQTVRDVLGSRDIGIVKSTRRTAWLESPIGGWTATWTGDLKSDSTRSRVFKPRVGWGFRVFCRSGADVEVYHLFEGRSIETILLQKLTGAWSS